MLKTLYAGSTRLDRSRISACTFFLENQFRLSVRRLSSGIRFLFLPAGGLLQISCSDAQKDLPYLQLPVPSTAKSDLDERRTLQQFPES